MPKASKSPAIETLPPAPTADRWVVMETGWYCGSFLSAGDTVTHVSLAQLLADEGQRVTRAPQG